MGDANKGHTTLYYCSRSTVPLYLSVPASCRNIFWYVWYTVSNLTPRHVAAASPLHVGTPPSPPHVHYSTVGDEYTEHGEDAESHIAHVDDLSEFRTDISRGNRRTRSYTAPARHNVENCLTESSAGDNCDCDEDGENDVIQHRS